MSVSARAPLALLFLFLLAADAPDPPARPASPSIRWTPTAVEVVGLDPANLQALARPASDHDARRPSPLSVSVASARPEATPPIAGTARVVGAVLRFEPRFPFEPGLTYRARFDPSQLPRPEARPAVLSEFTLPARAPTAPTVVVRVDPVSDRVPENLLKFYLHFSAPMRRGDAYARVHLLDADGRALEVPFLELGEELWDRSGTRLTLLLDPGRIKRDLRPREEEGPILVAGKSYTLVVDRGWRDASGNPLRETYRKTFRAGPADETRLDPNSWTIAAPAPETRDPLTITFPAPLDRALLDHALALRDGDPEGRAIAGRVEVNPEATRWRFHPDQPWRRGTYALAIDAELEDLAGNNLERPFEVDLTRPIERAIVGKTVTVEVRIERD